MLAAAALGIVGYIQFSVYALRPGLVSLSEMLGAAMGLMVLPVLVVVPWRVLQRRSGRYINNPLLAAVAVFVVESLFVIQGAHL